MLFALGCVLGFALAALGLSAWWLVGGLVLLGSWRVLAALGNAAKQGEAESIVRAAMERNGMTLVDPKGIGLAAPDPSTAAEHDAAWERAKPNGSNAAGFHDERCPCAACVSSRAEGFARKASPRSEASEEECDRLALTGTTFGDDLTAESVEHLREVFGPERIGTAGYGRPMNTARAQDAPVSGRTWTT